MSESVKESVETLEKSIAEFKTEYEKYTEKNVNSSGSKSRKALMAAKKTINGLRKVILADQKAKKAAKKAEKPAKKEKAAEKAAE